MSEPDTETHPFIEPFLAEELVNIELQNFALRFEFSGSAVEIFGPFLLLEPSGSERRFHPSKRSGDVTALWRLIELSVVDVDWGDWIVVTFEDGSKLTILPTEPGNWCRGTLFGRFPKPGTLEVEDF